MKRDGLKPSRITIHCSASENFKTWDVEKIRRFHVDERGFSDIGYHFVIQPDGETQRGRALNAIGAHVKGSNLIEGGINVGICLIGLDSFTKRQFVSLRSTIQFLLSSYNLPEHKIYCHYEYASANGKTCPNMRAAALMAWFVGHNDRAIDSYIGRD